MVVQITKPDSQLSNNEPHREAETHCGKEEQRKSNEQRRNLASLVGGKGLISHKGIKNTITANVISSSKGGEGISRKLSASNLLLKITVLTS